MRRRSPSIVSRRGFLGACAAFSVSGPGLSSAQSATRFTEDLEIREITVPGDPRLARRALVLSPKHGREGERFPVLVLLHGLGETDNEELGVHAWSNRYGLIDADAHLRHPPVSGARRYLSDERAARIDAELARRPYRGFVLVCPVTPNVYKFPPPSVALDHYADWIAGTLLPEVRACTRATTDVAETAIDGVSLGGYVAFEVFSRKPDVFGAVGGVQTAIGEQTAHVYAARLRALIDRVGPRGVHIESSIWDPSLPAHVAMSKRLDQLGVPHDLDVLNGGHDQIFLREVGTLEMLLWHDRRLQK